MIESTSKPTSLRAPWLGAVACAVRLSTVISACLRGCSQDVYISERIVLRDDAGRVRIVIGSPLLLPGMDSCALHFMPETGIFCYDEEGSCLAQLSEGSLSLSPAHGNGWAVLGTNMPSKTGADDAGGGFLHLFSAEDPPTRLLLRAQEGEPALELYREHDRLELRLPE